MLNLNEAILRTNYTDEVLSEAKKLYKEGWYLENWGAILTDTNEEIELKNPDGESRYWADGISRKTEDAFGIIGMDDSDESDEILMALSELCYAKNRPIEILGVLSSPIGFTGLTVKFSEVKTQAGLSLKGVSHYIGHPDTRAIVESMGAVYKEGLFSPEVNWASTRKVYLAFPLIRNARENGWTENSPVSNLGELKVIMCEIIS